MPAKEASKTTKPVAAAKPKVAAKVAAKGAPKARAAAKVVRKTNKVQPKKIAAKVRPTKLVIDCTNPVNHGIIDISSFEKYLHDKFKPTRTAKAGVLGEAVTITKANSQIVINVTKPIRKAYLKYLTKRYLKKQQLRDWLRVVATARNAYELRYYNIQEAGDESDDDEEDEE